MTQAGIADYVWLGYPDGGLMGIKDCTETIKFEKYTKIFLPWRDDNHPDHTAAFMYSLEVIKKDVMRKLKSMSTKFMCRFMM